VSLRDGTRAHQTARSPMRVEVEQLAALAHELTSATAFDTPTVGVDQLLLALLAATCTRIHHRYRRRRRLELEHVGRPGLRVEAGAEAQGGP
jgi:hypothetical protein